MKILILGGYGNFGGRLAELLMDQSGTELLIAGRNLARAKAFCASMKGRAGLRPLQLDRNAIESALVAERPDLVVDASGPFQSMAYEIYGVVRACIAHRINYLDLADGAEFVDGISQFDAQACAAGVFVLSGASSFPALSGAVLREISGGMHITSVTGGVAPSPFAGIGLNVMRAILGYAGQPVALLRNGVASSAPGLVESRRFTIAAPGALPLASRRFSLVDVPDLRLLPQAYPALRDTWFGAGTAPGFLLRLLNLLARLRAWFGWPPLPRLAGSCHRVMQHLRYGEHRGGMFLRVRGLRDGRETERSWHLQAEGDDGPYIPSMAVAAMVRKLGDGRCPAPGARPATDALTLADFEAMFRERAITCGFRDHSPVDAPLYRRVLAGAFDDLPEPVRRFHDGNGVRSWQGRAQVRRGTGLAARAIARIFGFPKATPDIAVSVQVLPERGGERWQRAFGSSRFSSLQTCGTGRNDHLVVERFGPIGIALALVLEGEKLLLIPRRWSCLGVPLPSALLPRGRTFETGQAGRFRFDVEIAAPLVGLVVAYRGWLVPDATTEAAQGAERGTALPLRVAQSSSICRG